MLPYTCLLIYFVCKTLCDQRSLQNGIHSNSAVCFLQVHIAAKRCQEPGCRKRPSFGFPGDKAEFCAVHKSADMVCHQYIWLLIHFVRAMVV